MKAITVEPKKPGTTRLEDVAEPDAREGSGPGRSHRRRRLRDRCRDRRGERRLGASRKTRLVLGDESAAVW